MESNRKTINLPAAKNKSGDTIYEEVLVDDIGNHHFKIIATPALVLGIAAGDEIFFRHEKSEFSVVKRGGNVAIQLHGDNFIVDKYLDELSVLTHQVDGRATDMTVLTVSIKLGFLKIQEILNIFCTKHPEISWYYGNIYDPEDGVTPLNWWIS
jgi:Domain of unknown function (DUF4265)